MKYLFRDNVFEMINRNKNKIKYIRVVWFKLYKNTFTYETKLVNKFSYLQKISEMLAEKQK